MRSSAKLLLLYGFVLTATATTGCYRTVASIHVDNTHRLFLDRSREVADDDESLSIVETNERRIVRVGCRYRLTVTVSGDQGTVRAEHYDSVDPEARARVPNVNRCPSELRLDSDGILEIQTGRDRYRFSLDHFERADVNRFRLSTTAILAAGIVLFAGEAVTGIVFAALASAASSF